MSGSTLLLLLLGGGAVALLALNAKKNETAPTPRLSPGAARAALGESASNPTVANMIGKPLYGGYCDPDLQSCPDLNYSPQGSACDPNFSSCR